MPIYKPDNNQKPNDTYSCYGSHINQRQAKAYDNRKTYQLEGDNNDMHTIDDMYIKIDDNTSFINKGLTEIYTGAQSILRKIGIDLLENLGLEEIYRKHLNMEEEDLNNIIENPEIINAKKIVYNEPTKIEEFEEVLSEMSEDRTVLNDINNAMGELYDFSEGSGEDCVDFVAMSFLSTLDCSVRNLSVEHKDYLDFKWPSYQVLIHEEKCSGIFLKDSDPEQFQKLLSTKQDALNLNCDKERRSGCCIRYEYTSVESEAPVEDTVCINVANRYQCNTNYIASFADNIIPPTIPRENVIIKNTALHEDALCDLIVCELPTDGWCLSNKDNILEYRCQQSSVDFCVENSGRFFTNQESCLEKEYDDPKSYGHKIGACCYKYRSLYTNKIDSECKEVYSEQECSELCDNTSECVGYSWRGSGTSCSISGGQPDCCCSAYGENDFDNCFYTNRNSRHLLAQTDIRHNLYASVFCLKSYIGYSQNHRCVPSDAVNCHNSNGQAYNSFDLCEQARLEI